MLQTQALHIQFSNTDNPYYLYQLCKGRSTLISQVWADSLDDVQRAVEAMYKGSDVIFESTLDNTINLTATLDGICPADLDALDSTYIVMLDEMPVSFFYKGTWFTRSKDNSEEIK